MIHDQHMHSSFSRDSNEDLENYFKEAKKIGIKYVATCEHIDFKTCIDNTTWDCDFSGLIKYEKELEKKYDIKPLLGVELGYRRDFLQEILDIKNGYDFDIVQLSVHDNSKIDYYYESLFDNIDDILNEYFDLIYEGMNNIKDFDILSHIDYCFKTALKKDNSLKINKYEDKIIKIFKYLIENDKCLEVNSKVQTTINEIYMKQKDYKFDDHIRYLLKLYKSLGGKNVSLSSDAHVVKNYRCDFDKHIEVIKECGFDKLVYYIKRKKYYYNL